MSDPPMRKRKARVDTNWKKQPYRTVSDVMSDPLCLVWKVVHLDIFEVTHVRLAARHRDDSAKKKNLKDKNHPNASVTNWPAFHPIGAGGECAMAKGTNTYWNFSCDTFSDEPDVAGCEVRTRSVHGEELYVWQDESYKKLNRPFVLVTGNLESEKDAPPNSDPCFLIHGWYWGWDIQADFEPLTRGAAPSHYVPQNRLRPIEDLFLTENIVLPTPPTSEEGKRFIDPGNYR